MSSQVVESALGFAATVSAYQLLHRTIGSPDRLANLQKYPDSARVYLPNGKPGTGQPVHATGPGPYPDADGRGGAAGPGAGPVTRSRSAGRRDVFYKGDVARRMVQALHDLGGLYTYEDFAEYTSPLEEPLSTTYRGYELCTNAPGPGYYLAGR